jgi:hypothetical protein
MKLHRPVKGGLVSAATALLLTGMSCRTNWGLESNVSPDPVVT